MNSRHESDRISKSEIRTSTKSRLGLGAEPMPRDLYRWLHMGRLGNLVSGLIASDQILTDELVKPHFFTKVL